MSKIRGYVLDSDTELPIGGVAIYLVSPKGQQLGVIASTNDDGDFEFDLPDNGNVEFDFPGYAGKVIDPRYLPASGKVLLDPDPSNSIEGVVVKSVIKRTVEKPSYILPIALGAAGLVLFGISIAVK